MDSARKMNNFPTTPSILLHTVSLAFVHNAEDLNQTQEAMSVVKDMLEGVGYLNYVKKLRPTLQQIFQHWIKKMSGWFVMMLALLLSSFASLLSLYPRGLNRFVEYTKWLFNRNRKAKAITSGMTYEIPLKWTSDPVLVTREWNQARKDNAARLKTHPHPSPLEPGAQELKHLTTYKIYNEVNILPNLKPGKAPTPLIICEGVGFANTPSSTSDSNKISAIMHRLMHGLEHSNQEMVLEDCFAKQTCIDLGIIPDTKYGLEYIKNNPVCDMVTFANTEYGGRHDKSKLAKYLAAAKKVNETEVQDEFYVEWFVKGENAPAKQDNNKCRGIFVPLDTWSCRTAPYLYRLTKMVVNYTQLPDKISTVTITSGMMGPELGDWMLATTEHFGEDYFIMEIDISAFEANQTFEQNASWFQYYREMTAETNGGDDFSYLMGLSNIVDFKEKINRAGTRTAWNLVARRHGGMPSGVPDVTLRNSLNYQSDGGFVHFLGITKRGLEKWRRNSFLSPG
jgi:hypothetical protein